jgi:hypothetical protein
MAFAFKSKTVPIWDTFGIEIVLGIQDVLGPVQALAPFQELHHVLDQETVAVNKFIEIWSLPFEFDYTVTPENEYLGQ